MTRSLRNIALPLLLVSGIGVTTGCDALSVADTPLGITAEKISYAPGESVTGAVENPDGAMTVTLAALGTDPDGDVTGDTDDRAQDPDADGTTSCAYDSDEKTYTCDTAGLPLGQYAVQVTDAAQPGEGTQSVRVVLTDVEGFAPTVGEVPVELETGETFPREAYVLGEAGAPTSVPVTGWGSERRLRLEVTADGGGRVFGARLTTDADGSGTFRIKALEAADYYAVTVTDGSWTTRVPMTVSE